MSEVILYKCLDDKRCISKSPITVATVDCIFKDAINRMQPSITITGDYDVNYCKVNGKYYYLSDKIIDVGNRVTYLMDIDVLMTYRDEILACNGIRVRSTKDGDNRYIRDDVAHVFQNKCYTDIKVFENGLSDNGEFILVTVGGASSVGV